MTFVAGHQVAGFRADPLFQIVDIGSTVGQYPFVAKAVFFDREYLLEREWEGDLLDLPQAYLLVDALKDRVTIVGPYWTAGEGIELVYDIALFGKRIAEAVSLRVEHIAMLTIGTNPDIASFGEQHTHHTVVDDVYRVAGIGFEVLGLLTVEAHQAVPCAKPDISVAVLYKVGDLAL